MRYVYQIFELENFINIFFFVSIFMILFLILFYQKNVYKYKKTLYYGGLLLGIRMIIIFRIPIITIKIRSYEIIPFLLKNFTIYDFTKDIYKSFSMGSFLFCFFLSISLILFFISLLKFLNIIKTIKYLPKPENDIFLIIQKNAKLLKLKKKVDIRESNNFTCPFVIGYFKPIIIIPKTIYSECEMDCIILHELLHIKKNHQFIKLFLEFFNCILWWNPMSYIFVKKMYYLMELEVDDEVLKLYNNKEYISAIYKTVEKTNKIKIPLLGMGIFDTTNCFERRINYIKNNNHKVSKSLSVFTSIFISIMLLSSYSIYITPIYFYPPSFYIDDTKAFLDNGYIAIDKENQRFFFCDKNGCILGGADGVLHPDYIKNYTVKAFSNEMTLTEQYYQKK